MDQQRHDDEDQQEAGPSRNPKEIYLSLLPHDRLVYLLLCLDEDREFEIWPENLEAEIAHLQAQHHQHSPHRQPEASTSYQPLPIPVQYPAVPYNGVPGPPQPQPAAVSSEDAAALPSYEDMIVMALAELSDPEGSPPKTVFQWMASRWSLLTNFRPSASQALQKAYKRGRLEKINNKYRLNPNWEGGRTTKRGTRRPQVGLGATTTAPTFIWPVPPPPPPINYSHHPYTSQHEDGESHEEMQLMEHEHEEDYEHDQQREFRPEHVDEKEDDRQQEQHHRSEEQSYQQEQPQRPQPQPTKKASKATLKESLNILAKQLAAASAKAKAKREREREGREMEMHRVAEPVAH